MPEIPGQPTQADIDIQRGYRVTKWKTHDNFECLKCQYASLWLEKMEKHLAIGEHPWAYPSPETGALGTLPPPDKLEY